MKAYTEHGVKEVAAHLHEYVEPASRYMALTHYECRICGQQVPISLVKLTSTTY